MEDPAGAFYETLAKRYGALWGYPGDPRVILFMKIEHIAGQNLQDDKGFLWLAPD